MNKNDWSDAFPEAPEGFHKAVQNTLNYQILNEKKKVTHMKRRITTIVAVAAVLLFLSCAAYAANLAWNAKLAEKFDANDTLQEQLSAQGALADVNASVTENGITVNVLQTIGDKNGIYMLLDVIAPEGMTLTDSTVFESANVRIDGADDNFSCFSGFVDGTVETNERYYELRLLNQDIQDVNGKTITLALDDLVTDNGSQSTVLANGHWELTWTLSYSDETATIAQNVSGSINGHDITVEYVQLSPLSMTVKLSGGGLAALMKDSEADGRFCILTLTMKDGTKISVDGAGTEHWDDGSYEKLVSLEQVLDVDTLSSLTIDFPCESANSSLTINID